MYQFYYIEFSLLQAVFKKAYTIKSLFYDCLMLDFFNIVIFLKKIFVESYESQNFPTFCSVHDGKRPYECEIGIKFFFLKGKLNRHIAFIHDWKKPYKCEVCSFFLLIDNLVKHIISVLFFSSKRQPKRIQVISP